MSDKRQRLIDRMIRIYGFEHQIVIDFCKLCESYADSEWNDQCLTTLVEAHEACPQLNTKCQGNK